MRISIIIPTLGERHEIFHTLESIHSNTTNYTFEVIVVNNGKKNLIKYPRKYFSRLKLKVIKESKLGLHYARNKGVKLAKSQIIAFLDDDVIVDQNWIDTIVLAFSKERKVGLVGGPVLPKYEVRAPEWIQNTFSVSKEGSSNLFLSLINLGKKEKYCTHEYIIGCNMSFRKDLYLKIGGSHPDLMPSGSELLRGDGETYIARAIRDLGYDAKYLPGMSVQHIVGKSRLTKKYIFSRAYYQAYEDLYSYTRSAIGPKINVRALYLLAKKLLQIILFERRVNTISIIIYLITKPEKANNLLFSNMISLYYFAGAANYIYSYVSYIELRNWVNQTKYN